MTQDKDPADPKGLIREAYRIEGITYEECRSIFMDWALSVPASDPREQIAALLARHAPQGTDDHAPDDHPMSRVLAEGLDSPPAARRRGGRAARVPGGGNQGRS